MFHPKILGHIWRINHYYIKNIKKVRIKNTDADISPNLKRSYDQTLKINLGGAFLTLLETRPTPFRKA
jgi:hypothetical protein